MISHMIHIVDNMDFSYMDDMDYTSINAAVDAAENAASGGAPVEGGHSGGVVQSVESVDGDRESTVDDMNLMVDTSKTNWVCLQKPLNFIMVEVVGMRATFLCKECATIYSTFWLACNNAHVCLRKNKVVMSSRVVISNLDDCTVYKLAELRNLCCVASVLHKLTNQPKKSPFSCPVLPRCIVNLADRVQLLSGSARAACRICNICCLVFKNRKSGIQHLDAKSGKDTHPDVCLSTASAVPYAVGSKRIKVVRSLEETARRKRLIDECCVVVGGKFDVICVSKTANSHRYYLVPTLPCATVDDDSTCSSVDKLHHVKNFVTGKKNLRPSGVESKGPEVDDAVLLRSAISLFDSSSKKPVARLSILELEGSKYRVPADDTINVAFFEKFTRMFFTFHDFGNIDTVCQDAIKLDPSACDFIKTHIPELLDSKLVVRILMKLRNAIFDEGLVSVLERHTVCNSLESSSSEHAFDRTLHDIEDTTLTRYVNQAYYPILVRYIAVNTQFAAEALSNLMSSDGMVMSDGGQREQLVFAFLQRLWLQLLNLCLDEGGKRFVHNFIIYTLKLK